MMLNVAPGGLEGFSRFKRQHEPLDIDRKAEQACLHVHVCGQFLLEAHFCYMGQGRLYNPFRLVRG